MQTVRAVMPSDFLGFQLAGVELAGASVFARIAVEQFHIFTGIRNADSIVFMVNRGKIAHDDKHILRITGLPHKRGDTLLLIVRIDPGESFS